MLPAVLPPDNVTEPPEGTDTGVAIGPRSCPATNPEDPAEFDAFTYVLKYL